MITNMHEKQTAEDCEKTGVKRNTTNLEPHCLVCVELPIVEMRLLQLRVSVMLVVSLLGHAVANSRLTSPPHFGRVGICGCALRCLIHVRFVVMV